MLYSGEENSLPDTSNLLATNDTFPLVTLVPADFDGDLVTDFLLIYKVDNQYQLQICYGSKQSTYDMCGSLQWQSKGEPMIFELVCLVGHY